MMCAEIHTNGLHLMVYAYGHFLLLYLNLAINAHVCRESTPQVCVVCNVLDIVMCT